jgi:glycosyltransferase involved in cell wall biosynthesis
MPGPTITILINNFNYDKFLADAIRSALNQSYPALEVIVVDDGSTDSSREIIGSFGAQIKSILKANGGQASAFNDGFKASSGDIVCFLDSDDVFKPNKVERVVEAFSSSPDAQWCFHALDFFSEDPQQSWPDLRGPVVMTGERDFRDQIRQGRLKFSAPATTGCSFQRKLLDHILPMPTTTGVALNDNYLKFAAMTLAPGYYVSEALAYQRLHPDNAYTFRPDRTGLHARGKILTAYWLRRRFPQAHNFTDKLLCAGVAQSGRSGGMDPDSSLCRRIYYAGSSAPKKVSLSARVAYYTARSLARHARNIRQK